jgi:3-hydroxyisobutyrate dehydrogenase-like beta-hydroxyacid dehydrogenase
MPKRGAESRRAGTVGVVGLGIMGSAMAANLVKAGFRVIGYDVVAAKRHALRRAGGVAAPDIATVAASAATIITSLPSAQALLDVAAALASPVASGFSRNIVVETSTLPIEVKEQARATLARRGSTLLDCPLSGTGAQAKNKDLVVYASGDRRACRAAAPVFDGFSRAHYYVGPFGAGSKMKFVANLLVAIHNVAAAEAFVLAERAGLDPALTYEVIANSAGSSRMLQMRGPMMVKRRYTPATMKLDVWKKDMRVIADFARALGVRTPLFSATAPWYEAARTAGRSHEDTAAVHAVIERLSPPARRRRR